MMKDVRKKSTRKDKEAKQRQMFAQKYQHNELVIK
jgi:hypothetical protein